MLIESTKNLTAVMDCLDAWLKVQVRLVSDLHWVPNAWQIHFDGINIAFHCSFTENIFSKLEGFFYEANSYF